MSAHRKSAGPEPVAHYLRGRGRRHVLRQTLPRQYPRPPGTYIEERIAALSDADYTEFRRKPRPFFRNWDREDRLIDKAIAAEARARRNAAVDAEAGSAS